MVYTPVAESNIGFDPEDKYKMFMKKYSDAEGIHDHWKDKYEEAYEYTMPSRESFYEETIGERRTDKIFDETAVVGIQEFASRLQAGLVPTYGRWANLEAGSEIPDEQKPSVNEALDEITKYVFEILAGSNFNQEVHEAFMDCAIGTGVMLIEEGDALNPIKFTAIPLPKVMLNNGPDNKVDTVFRKRQIAYNQLMVAYPKAEMSEKMLILDIHLSLAHNRHILPPY